jgi:hypothetical protein
MIWREIKISVFVLAMCLLASLSTIEIYKRNSGTTTSAWLLLPLFTLIAVTILASELLLQQSRPKDSVVSSCTSNTWSPGLVPAVAMLYVVVLPSQPAVASPPQATVAQSTGASIVATIVGHAEAEPRTLTLRVTES